MNTAPRLIAAPAWPRARRPVTPPTARILGGLEEHQVGRRVVEERIESPPVAQKNEAGPN